MIFIALISHVFLSSLSSLPNLPKYSNAGLLASVSVNSIQISGDHFLDCKSWLGMSGNGRQGVLYQLAVTVELGGFENSHRYWFLADAAAAEGRASLVRVTLPSHQMITSNLRVLHISINANNSSMLMVLLDPGPSNS